jgi:glutamate-5-semialdehyde dehydrogenase
MIDRLRLDERRLEAIARAVDEIAGQPELVGRIEREEVRPNGLAVARMRIPLGVIAIIYEARPNVTVDAAALCLKAGNAAILRGGSEAFHSNQALGAAVASGLVAAGLPAAAVTLVPSTDRDAIRALIGFDDLIDLVIPRGGEGLIRFVAEHSRVPVIKHYKGVCHLYVHQDADLDMAKVWRSRRVDNGKVIAATPGVCNALETILVDRADGGDVRADRLCAHLRERGVEIRGDAEVVRLGGPGIHPATAADWDAEYLDLIVAMAVVDDLDGAIAHIERHGSDHTEAIVTRDQAAADRFLAEVGSSTVCHNASTRFADGGELGLGAEIGISTTRLHAYGPMGAEGLTTAKFVVRGTGQIRG